MVKHKQHTSLWLTCLMGAFLMLLGQGAWAAAYTPGAGFTNSPHDFADDLKGDGTALATETTLFGDQCTVCHTPHGADTDTPLWGHTSSTTFTTYGVLASGTADPGNPTGISLMCMSCHDGATNVDAYGGDAGSEKIDTSYGTAVKLGADMGTNHPVGVTFTGGGEFQASVTSTKLYNSKVECASCHNVHNGTGTSTKLTRVSGIEALCDDCHKK